MMTQKMLIFEYNLKYQYLSDLKTLRMQDVMPCHEEKEKRREAREGGESGLIFTTIPKEQPRKSCKQHSHINITKTQ